MSMRNRSWLKKVQRSRLSVCKFRDCYQIQQLQIPCDSGDKAYCVKARKWGNRSQVQSSPFRVVFALLIRGISAKRPRSIPTEPVNPEPLNL